MWRMTITQTGEKLFGVKVPLVGKSEDDENG